MQIKDVNEIIGKTVASAGEGSDYMGIMFTDGSYILFKQESYGDGVTEHEGNYSLIPYDIHRNYELKEMGLISYEVYKEYEKKFEDDKLKEAKKKEERKAKQELADYKRLKAKFEKTTAPTKQNS